MGERRDVSVIVPVFNEVESLPHLFAALRPVLEGLGRSYEIVFCDDGSRDGSLDELRRLASEDAHVRVISFRRNFGQTAALEAGFRNSCGDVIVAMDADLQNDPRDIPALLAKIDEGADVVSGWRKDRHDAFLTRVLPSRIANAIISRVTGVRLHDYGCTLTAYRAEVMREVRLYGEMHRFIPAFAAWAGARIVEMPVTHHSRRYGSAKYGLSRILRVVLDLMTVRFLVGYATKPLYLFGKWGFASLLISLLCAVEVIAKRLIKGPEFPIFADPFFLVTIFFAVAGTQVILFGLLAELSMRTYFESQQKPTYLVKESLNIDRVR